MNEHLTQTVQANLASIARGDPVYQRWQDYRRAFSWHGSGNNARRLEYPAVEAALVRSHLIVVPAAQACPERRDDGDVVYLAAAGEVEFTVGANRFLLKPLDIITVPAGTTYGYANLGLANAILCGVFAKPAQGERGASKASSGSAPLHMVWEQYRRDFRWTLPLAERWGYHRGSGPLIISDGLRGHTVRMPPGQTTPWHAPARDMVFMGISDEVEFKAGGHEWPLGPRDFLIVPAGTPYTYTNYGLAECVFFSIGGKLEPGKKAIYYADDPGWPVRSDARIIEVEIDKHGDARVVEPKA